METKEMKKAGKGKVQARPKVQGDTQPGQAGKAGGKGDAGGRQGMLAVTGVFMRWQSVA